MIKYYNFFLHIQYNYQSYFISSFYIYYIYLNYFYKSLKFFYLDYIYFLSFNYLSIFFIYYICIFFAYFFWLLHLSQQRLINTIKKIITITPAIEHPIIIPRNVATDIPQQI